MFSVSPVPYWEEMSFIQPPETFPQFQKADENSFLTERGENEERKEKQSRSSNAAILPGESHGWRSLVGCSPWSREESDTTGQLHFPFSLSCIGEGNGNPLQCSCLENPRDGGAWWAAVYGVAQSRTRLKRLSSSSSSSSATVGQDPGSS